MMLIISIKCFLGNNSARFHPPVIHRKGPQRPYASFSLEGGTSGVTTKYEPNRLPMIHQFFSPENNLIVYLNVFKLNYIMNYNALLLLMLFSVLIVVKYG